MEKKPKTIKVSTLVAVVLAVLYLALIAGFYYYHKTKDERVTYLESQNNNLVEQWHKTLQDNQNLINRVDLLENKDDDYSKIFKDNWKP